MIRKTAAITAASIAGVILAGGAAVGANIGILNAAGDSNLGELSAQAPITTPTTEPVASFESVASFEASMGNSQSFTVDIAGEVEIEAADKGLNLSDVRTNQGWSWEQTSTTDGTVMVSFSSSSDQLVFTATSNDDGTISARVDRPIVTTTPSPTQASSGSSPGYVDDDEYEDHDDYEYDEEYEEYDDYEYEGRDDDD